MSSFATEYGESKANWYASSSGVVVGGRERLARLVPRLARAEIDRQPARLHVDPRARLDDELLVRLLHREVVDRVAEVVLALRVHGRRRIDRASRCRALVCRGWRPRREVQHVVRHRDDVLVRERGRVADVVDHRGDSSAAARRRPLRRRVAEESLAMWSESSCTSRSMRRASRSSSMRVVEAASRSRRAPSGSASRSSLAEPHRDLLVARHDPVVARCPAGCSM